MGCQGPLSRHGEAKWNEVSSPSLEWPNIELDLKGKHAFSNSHRGSQRLSGWLWGCWPRPILGRGVWGGATQDNQAGVSIKAAVGEGHGWEALASGP